MKLPVYRWRDLEASARSAALARPASRAAADVAATVRDIIADVRRDGDAALRRISARLDGVAPESLKVAPSEFDEAREALDADDVAAIRAAIDNIRRFHEAQRPRALRVETMPGVHCERISQPIDAVGLYVPAGSAPLPSAAMMLAVPAAIAEAIRPLVEE